MAAVIDQTQADLERLIKADLGERIIKLGIQRSLIDWFHFRARMVAQRLRVVTLSAEVQAQAVAFPAIRQIAEALHTGADISPWLSDRVRLRKADHKADMMFNDWQISHFHLGSYFVAPDKIKRSDSLLFGYVDNVEAVLLKLGSHSAWTDEDVLSQLLETRPPLMERWHLKGILPPRGNPPSKEERFKLRAVGLSTNVVLGERVFSPSIGIASSGHATRLVLKAQRFLRALAKCKDDIENNSTARETRSRLAFPIGVPVELRVKLEKNGDLIVYDSVRSWSFFQETAPA